MACAAGESRGRGGLRGGPGDADAAPGLGDICSQWWPR